MRAVERNGLSRISRGRSAGAVALGAFALLIATTGQAAPLAFQASLSIVISSYGVGFSGEGVAEVDGYGHLASLSIPAGAFDVVGTRVTITTPAAFPIQGLQATAANGAGSFANPGGGVMPLIGAARVCLFATCDGCGRESQRTARRHRHGRQRHCDGTREPDGGRSSVDVRYGPGGNRDREGLRARTGGPDVEHGARLGRAPARDPDLHLDQHSGRQLDPPGLWHPDAALRPRADDAGAPRRWPRRSRRGRRPRAPRLNPLPSCA